MNVREFLTTIGFKADTHEVEHAEHALHHLQETVEDLKEKLEFLAAAEIIHKLYEISERFAHWGEELKVMSENMGISTDELQRLNVAAERSGVASEEMTTGLARLSRQLYEAKTGSKEAAMAFQKVGITSEQISKFHTAKDALYALADRISATKDPIARMAQAQELLGRGGFRMVSFLAKGSQAMREQGAEAEKLGLILSGDQVEALERVEHAFQRFHGLLHSIGASIASYLAPAFTSLIDKLIEFYQANKDVIGINISNWLYDVSYSMGFLTGLVLWLTKKLLELAKSFGLDHNILGMVAKFSGVVTGIWLFLKTVGIAKGILSTFSTLFGPIHFVFNLLRTVFLGLIAPLASATAGLFGIDAAAAPALVTVGGLAAIVGGLVIAAHDLYIILSGSAENTWIGSFARFLGLLDDKDGASILNHVRDALSSIPGFSGAFDWISGVIKRFKEWLLSIDAVRGALDAISSIGSKIGDWLGKQGIPGFGHSNNAAVPPAADKNAAGTESAKGSKLGGLMNMLGGGSTGTPSLPERVEALNSPDRALGGATSVVNNMSGGTQNYNFDITMPITVPAGTDVKDVGHKVKEGFKEHIEYLQRTIQRGTASPVER